MASDVSNSAAIGESAKVVATSSKNDHDSSSEEGVPVAKKPPVNGFAAVLKRNVSSDGSCYDYDRISAEENVVVKKVPA